MSFPIETLPDETLLHLFKFLKFKDLGRCLQVSKRFRKMALDETLWEKIKFVDQDVSAEFLIQALTHGAKHLSLEWTESLPPFYRIYTFSQDGMDSLEFPVQNQLKTLNLEIDAAQMIMSALFDSCQGLEKLYLRLPRFSQLNPALSYIASYGRSLKVLNIGKILLGLNEVKIICDNCVELKEFTVVLGSPDPVSYFCENLTPEMRKLNIFTPNDNMTEQFFEQAVEKLIKRCNKLIALSIIGTTTVTINGISNIMKHLSQTLEKIRFRLPTHAWRSEQGWLDLEKTSLDLQGFEFQPMLKLTEVCFHQLDPSLHPQIQQVFHRELPLVNTVFSNLADYDYGIAVPDVEK